MRIELYCSLTFKSVRMLLKPGFYCTCTCNMVSHMGGTGGITLFHALQIEVTNSTVSRKNFGEWLSLAAHFKVLRVSPERSFTYLMKCVRLHQCWESTRAICLLKSSPHTSISSSSRVSLHRSRGRRVKPSSKLSVSV